MDLEWVYPRVCGGIRRRPCPLQKPLGLSPRVRGHHVVHLLGHVPKGSIPACAGASPHHVYLDGATRVYPRVCGGIVSCALLTVSSSGLSPRVRGHLVLARTGEHDTGSIPACAGASRDDPRGADRHRVYPRVCGGIPSWVLLATSFQGLSPRVRGHPPKPGVFRPVSGSIPACAGASRRPEAPEVACGVYPRVCGGIQVPSADYQTKWGLSPRVRGHLSLGLRLRPAAGSIPACAGASPVDPASAF